MNEVSLISFPYNDTSTNPPVAEVHSPSATYTETAFPFHPVPSNERSNPIANNTIRKYPHLFRVVTPVNAHNLERLLWTHPNRALVHSACRGIREGFWPYAITEETNFPSITSFGFTPKFDTAKTEFIRAKTNEEIKGARYSPGFTTLLPGMHCQPLFLVPKAGGTYRIINHHSLGKYAPNSLIDPEAIAGTKLDNIKDFCHILRRVHRQNSGKPIWLFKSDVSEAYRRLPMHPLWQIRQIVKVDGAYHVDRCCIFGGKASARIFCLFMGLVIWIAIHVKGLKDVLHYVDDAFSYDLSPSLEYYEPYGKYLPPRQVRLLRLWDEVGLPHKEKKQEYGRALVILGFYFDTKTATLDVPADVKKEIISEIRAMIDTTQSRIRKMTEWQSLLGRINWALIAAPLLRPAMHSAWRKLSNPPNPKIVEIDDRVAADLGWLADNLECSMGLNYLIEKEWDVNSADVTVWCDAAKDGLGFWSPNHPMGYYGDIPPNLKPNISHINFYEGLCVVSALEWAIRFYTPKRLVIYTDSSSTAKAYEDLSVKEGYNGMLFYAMKLLIKSGTTLRVIHIPGEENTVADALSRKKFDKFHELRPSWPLQEFSPPPDALVGATVL